MTEANQKLIARLWEQARLVPAERPQIKKLLRQIMKNS